MPEVPVQPATPADPQPPADPPPILHERFAAWVALVVFALAVLILWRPAWNSWDIDVGDWKDAATGSNALATSVSMPLTILGTVVVLIGAWMAVVEWRGRFAEKPADGPAGRGPHRDELPDIPKIIEAIGKLRGAALVMVVGAVLMLGAAWIAESGVSGEAPPTGTTGQTGPTDN